MFPRVASRAGIVYLAARTHNRAAVFLYETHIAALREFWTDGGRGGGTLGLAFPRPNALPNTMVVMPSSAATSRMLAFSFTSLGVSPSPAPGGVAEAWLLRLPVDVCVCAAHVCVRACVRGLRMQDGGDARRRVLCVCACERGEQDVVWGTCPARRGRR